MSTLAQLAIIILAGFLIWRLYVFARHNPRAFSKDSLGHSAFTLGILCLILIAFVALLVLWLKK
jgi:hypothetical protein